MIDGLWLRLDGGAGSDIDIGGRIDCDSIDGVGLGLGAQHRKRFANLLFLGEIETLIENELKHLNACLDVGSAVLASNRENKTLGFGTAVLVVGDVEIGQTIDDVGVTIAATDHFVQYSQVDIPSRSVRVGGCGIVLVAVANQPKRVLDVELLDYERAAPAPESIADDHGSCDSLNNEVQAFLCHD